MISPVMSAPLELWHLISLLLAFFACVGIFGRVLFVQFDKRLEERFVAQERLRGESQGQWSRRFDQLENSANDEREEWRRLERELLKLMASLPLDYVRREDWVRNQTVLESKIDGLALRIENLTLRQQK